MIQQKIINGETSFHEKRGHHNNRPKRTPENVLPLMKEHLSQISLEDSYLIPAKGDENTRLHYKKLYNSFSQFYQAKTETVVPISSRTYRTKFRRNSEFILSASANDKYLEYATVELVVFPQETGNSLEVNGPDPMIIVDELINETPVDQFPMLIENVPYDSNSTQNNHDAFLPDVDQSHDIQSSILHIELAGSNDTRFNHDLSSPPDGSADQDETEVEDPPARKSFRPVESCCTQKCYEKFEMSSQRYLYADFWNRGKSKQIQDLYLASCFSKADVKTQTVDSWKRRHRHKWHFFIRLDSINVSVCLSFLLNLYHISRKRIRIVQNKVLRGETSFAETRGRRTNQPKLPPKVIPLMKTHLSMIPHYYESTAASRCKHFKNPDLHLKKIFKSFLEYYEINMGTSLTIKFRTYENLFRTHSEFSFSQQGSPQCDFCVSFKSSALPTEDQLTAQITHEEFYKKYTELKDHLLDEAKQGNYLMIEFDYLPSIGVPRLNVAEEVYKQLPLVHGFNIHNHCDDSSYIYLFTESKTDKNFDSIISFIFTTIQPILQSKHTFRKVILLCNDCQGQSKHIPLVQFCSWMSTIHRIPFLQIFPVQGHSTNICRHNFQLFRQINKKRTRLISVKPILIDMVSARPLPSPFIVSYDSPIVNRWNEALSKFFAAQPKNTDKQRFLVQSYMQLEYSDGKVYSNCTFNDEPQLWTEFTYLIKNIEIANIVLHPAAFPGIVPEKRKNVFSLFHHMTSDEIINFQESFGV